jgi:hypothetical protein
MVYLVDIEGPSQKNWASPTRNTMFKDHRGRVGGHKIHLPTFSARDFPRRRVMLLAGELIEKNGDIPTNLGI